MATSGRSEAENTTAHGSDEGFVRALGLFPATTVNMSQMVGIGPFITIPLMISAMGGPQALIGWVLGARSGHFGVLWRGRVQLRHAKALVSGW